jgi:TRAP transporter TAXI family solute receptor
MRLLRALTIGLLFAASTAAAQQNLSIATGGTGGVYYPYGGGLAELISKHVPGYKAVAEVTGASVENVGLIARGDSDIAFALADTVHQAYNGEGRFEGRKLGNLRALGAVYPNAVHIVTLADSNIKSLKDLKGKRVSVGAPGSGTELSAKAILEANGVTYDDIDERRLNFNETASALKDGQIDAGFWSVGPPTSSIMDLATVRDIRFVSLSEQEQKKALQADPSFAPYKMPAGTYPEQEQQVNMISTPNVLVVNADMDEELAYQVVKTLFENTKQLIAIHPAAKDTTVEFSLDSTPIPLHPGAVRYYKEVGAKVPARLTAK